MTREDQLRERIPATEPRTWEEQADEARTEAGRDLLRDLIPRTGVSPLVGGRFLDVDSVLAIEAEAAQGAAPRAEGLDVDTLADALDAVAWHEWKSPQIDRTHTRNLARSVLAYLSRPSDERVPESEEPR